jgi:hypothetical protein
MAKPILLEQFHVTVLARRGLREDEAEAARRTLDAARFRADLRRAAVAVFARHPALARVRVAVTR